MFKRNPAFFGSHAFIKRVISILGVTVSAAGLFSAGLAGAAPAISAVAAGQVTATSAVITWQTDIASDTYVSYVATTGGSDAQFASDASLTTSHSITLTGLQPGTQYAFTANSADSQGDNAAVNGANFTTLTSGTTPPPSPVPPPPAPTPTPPPVPTPSPSPSGGGLSAPTGLQYSELVAVFGPKVTQPLYPTGTLAKDKGVIYFLMGKDQIKVPFTSMTAFTGLGYSLKNVQSLDLSMFELAKTYAISSPNEQHPWGQVLKAKDGTLYYSHPTGMIGIPTLGVLTANGLSEKMIVPMNAADEAVLAAAPVRYVLELNDDRIQ